MNRTLRRSVLGIVRLNVINSYKYFTKLQYLKCRQGHKNIRIREYTSWYPGSQLSQLNPPTQQIVIAEDNAIIRDGGSEDS